MDLANPVVKAFLAGSVSGTCTTVLFQPLDLVKTRIQNQQQNSKAPSSHHIGHLLYRRPGIFQTVHQVIVTEHVSGLWRGVVPSITRTVPGVGLYFGSLHWLKTHLRNSEKPSAIEAICLGIVARSFAGTMMIPFTVLKTRYESGRFHYTGMYMALIEIYRGEGLRGLTCGLAATLARDAPYSGLYLMFYTQLKQRQPSMMRFLHAAETGEHSVARFFCGILAGFMSSLLTHPADVIKTKMQIKPERYNSIAVTIGTVLSKSGPRGFLVGFVPRMARRTLVSAFAWTVYEKLMHKLGLEGTAAVAKSGPKNVS